MSIPPPMDATGTQYEEMPARSGSGGYVLALIYVAFGVVSVLFALDEGFRRGKVEFSNDVWRVVLGAIGVLAAFIGVRALVRAARGERRSLTPELHQRGARRGKILIAVGVGLLAAAIVPAIGDATVAFSGWAKLVYIVAGALSVLLGLVFQWNPTRYIRQQRVARGQGRPGVARIVSASDTGASVNDAPQVKIEFELDVGGQTHLVSDKIVMQRARLALLIPGSTVNVLVDQVDPNVFHIDWDSWKGPGQGEAPV